MMLQIRPDGVVHFTPVRVAHNVPESLAHYAPVEVAHYAPVCSVMLFSVGNQNPQHPASDFDTGKAYLEYLSMNLNAGGSFVIS
jgi:hypothetical protein